MQRSRRRKLLRDGKRNPLMLRAVNDRSLLRHLAYRGVNRASRRAAVAGAVEPRHRDLLREAWRQARTALR